MHVTFLYGPPAVGKLTVAKALSQLTTDPIFHNHATRDIVHDIFPDTLDQNYTLVTTLRNDVLAYCAQHDQNLIFTWVYDGATDDAVLATMVAAIQDNGGSINFVELHAPDAVLSQRVQHEDRTHHKKLTDPKILQQVLKEHSFTTVPYDNVLRIDSSLQTAPETARIIATHFDLCT